MKKELIGSLILLAFTFILGGSASFAQTSEEVGQSTPEPTSSFGNVSDCKVRAFDMAYQDHQMSRAVIASNCGSTEGIFTIYNPMGDLYTIPTIVLPDVIEVTLSPDVEQVAYTVVVEGDQEVQVVWVDPLQDADGLIKPTVISNGFNPVWSADGKSIIYLSQNEGGKVEIWSVDLEDMNKKRIDIDGCDDEDVTAVDVYGDVIYFAGYCNEKQNGVFRYDTKTKEISILSDTTDVIQLSHSPEGGKVSVVLKESVYYLYISDALAGVRHYIIHPCSNVVWVAENQFNCLDSEGLWHMYLDEADGSIVINPLFR